MEAKSSKRNPKFSQVNSVMGNVTSSGAANVTATITVVQTNETVEVPMPGSYSILLDPEKLGTDTHELVFSAPGHAEVRHTVVIPDQKRERLDVELIQDS